MGRHFVPVARLIILGFAVEVDVRKKDAATVYWPAGGLNDKEVYKPRREVTCSSDMAQTHEKRDACVTFLFLTRDLHSVN